MSTDLGFVDLSLAVLGTTFTLDWTTRQQQATLGHYSAGMSDHLTVYNESGCGLIASLNNTGRSFTIPAGAWIPGGIPLSVGGTADTVLTAVVQYILGNAGVSQFHADYFNVGEPVVSVSQVLGNSPVNIGRDVLPTVTSSTVNQHITSSGGTLFTGNVNTGIFRISGYLYFDSSPATNTHPTFNVSYNDINTGTQTIALRTYANVALDSTETLVAPSFLPIIPMTLAIGTGPANLQVSYTQGLAAGVNDFVSFAIERLA